MITALLCAIQAFSPSSRASAITHREIDHDRGSTSDARDHDEDAVGDRLLSTRDPGLRHRGRGAQREQRVLRVETGEQRTHSGRLHRRERIDRGHPFRGFRLGAGCRPLAPLAERDEEQDAPIAIWNTLPPVEDPWSPDWAGPTTAKTIAPHAARPRSQPPMKTGPLTRPRADTSINTTAMIGIGLQRDADRHREDLTDHVRHRYR